MKTSFVRKNPQFDQHKHELFLMPETDRERQQLENILDHCAVIGFGRDANTGHILHVRIEIPSASQTQAGHQQEQHQA